jgi:hypothetical protein
MTYIGRWVGQIGRIVGDSSWINEGSSVGAYDGDSVGSDVGC